MKRRYDLLIGAVVALSLALTGCGGSGDSSGQSMSTTASYDAGGYYDNALYAESAVETDYESDSAGELTNAEEVGESAAQTTRKLITTMNIQAETTSFDELLGWARTRVEALGGYVESEDVSNGSAYSSYRRRKSASLTLRIPAARLADFIAEIGERGNITGQSKNVQDVTLSYVDMQSRRSALQGEEERLLSFMEEATTIEELIAIEERLTDVRYQLESAESQLRTYDNRIDYSTVYLSINEVEIYTPVEEESVGQRIVHGFTDSVESVAEALVDFFVWFVTHIPQLIVLAIIIWLIALLIKKLRERKRKRDGGQVSGKHVRGLLRRRGRDKEESAGEESGAPTTGGGDKAGE